MRCGYAFPRISHRNMFFFHIVFLSNVGYKEEHMNIWEREMFAALLWIFKSNLIDSAEIMTFGGMWSNRLIVCTTSLHSHSFCS